MLIANIQWQVRWEPIYKGSHGVQGNVSTLEAICDVTGLVRLGVVLQYDYKLNLLIIKLHTSYICLKNVRSQNDLLSLFNKTKEMVI
jgi:hypothetical protein